MSGAEALTTNNRMELTAVINALELVVRDFPGRKSVEVITDSQYVQKGLGKWISNWIARGWKTASGNPVKNQDLWLRLDKLGRELSIDLKWIRGHSGDMWNERCDELVAEKRAMFS